MGAYEVWKETKHRLDEAPDNKYLQQTVDVLRDLAVKDYIEMHAGLNGDEEPMEFDQDEIREYLAGLDEIRGTPKSGEVEEARDLAFNTAIGRISQMERLPWTGDHLYGDALKDVRQVLLAAWKGKPNPVLKTFRCPSTFQQQATGANYVLHCELQIGHGGAHKVTDPFEAWTDEQSVNPPIDHNEDEPLKAGPRCISIDPESEILQCEYVPHTGMHRNGDVTWSTGAPIEQCRSKWHEYRCSRAAGHPGVHAHDGAPSLGGSSWTDTDETGKASA